MKIELSKFREYLYEKRFSEATRTAYISGVEDYMRHG